MEILRTCVSQTTPTVSLSTAAPSSLDFRCLSAYFEPLYSPFPLQYARRAVFSRSLRISDAVGIVFGTSQICASRGRVAQTVHSRKPGSWHRKRAGAVKLRPYLPRMSKLGNLILGLLLRSRNNAQLLHHAQLVHVVPTFHHFALLGEPEDAYPRNHHLIASGSDASELALVGAASLPTGNDLVPFGYLILDNAMKIGEGLTELAHESLDVLGATFQGSAVGLVGDVPVEDLVRQVEVPLVRDLFDVAPKDSLVLFGHRSLLLPPAFTGGIIFPTAMMPASEPRRTIGRACPRYPLALFTELPRRLPLM